MGLWMVVGMESWNGGGGSCNYACSMVMRIANGGVVVMCITDGNAGGRSDLGGGDVGCPNKVADVDGLSIAVTLLNRIA